MDYGVKGRKSSTRSVRPRRHDVELEPAPAQRRRDVIRPLAGKDMRDDSMSAFVFWVRSVCLLQVPGPTLSILLDRTPRSSKAA